TRNTSWQIWCRGVFFFYNKQAFFFAKIFTVNVQEPKFDGVRTRGWTMVKRVNYGVFIWFPGGGVGYRAEKSVRRGKV
ncbi:hypothetical protein ACVGWT_16765, partial [Enterobacter hormaechei]